MVSHPLLWTGDIFHLCRCGCYQCPRTLSPDVFFLLQFYCFKSFSVGVQLRSTAHWSASRSELRGKCPHTAGVWEKDVARLTGRGNIEKGWDVVTFWEKLSIFFETLWIIHQFWGHITHFFLVGGGGWKFSKSHSKESRWAQNVWNLASVTYDFDQCSR